MVKIDNTILDTSEIKIKKKILLTDGQSNRGRNVFCKPMIGSAPLMH